MNAITRKLSWPLLGKELIEQAARKRTYIMRVVYATVLMGIFLIQLQSNYGQWPDMGMLGQGWIFFKSILVCQCVGVLLFLPAMMAGVITSEKERGSLELLFLTDLKPGDIIGEKYLGRLLPMFTFLLISLPLLAVAYAFGGVDTGKLIDGVLMLFLTCLQLGAFSLMCSAYCRTTTGAVLASYLLGAVFYFFVPLLVLIFDPGFISRATEKWMFIFCPPAEYFSTFQNPLSNVSKPEVIIATLLTTCLFLEGAKRFLTRRAFATPRNRLLCWFRKLDGFFKAKNQLVGGHVFFAKPDSLPDDQPVAWRELERRSLGQWNYLVRIFIVVEAATLFLCLTFQYQVIETILWVTAALALSIQAINVIAQERTNQTLETLLTTPLPGRAILQQKMRGLYRLMWLFAIPLLSVLGVRIWLEYNRVGNVHVMSLFVPVASVIIYLPMITWVSLWLGLKCRKKNQALLLVLGILTVWSGVPPLVMGILGMSNIPHESFFRLSIGPVMGLRLFPRRYDLYDVFLILPFGFYALVLYSARVACLRRADRYLRGEATPLK